MIESAIPFFLFFLGLSVGSFINVVVFRFGFSESGASRSHCMACDAPIHWYDLIPVLSFLLLLGRCRSCGSILSLQYPLVEVSVAVLFYLSHVFLPMGLEFLPLLAYGALLGFLATLVALVVYDIRHTLVPMQFVFVLFGFALIAVVAQSIFHQSFLPLLDSLFGAGVLFIFFFAIVFTTRGKGMGMGDVYIAGVTGVMLGLVRGIEAVMLGIWSATAVYGSVLLLSSLAKQVPLLRYFPRVTIATELPLIPFLALGILLALFTSLSPLEVGSWLTGSLGFG